LTEVVRFCPARALEKLYMERGGVLGSNQDLKLKQPDAVKVQKIEIKTSFSFPRCE